MRNLNSLKEKALKNKSVREAYTKLESEFALMDSLLSMRKTSGLSQEEVAKRMDIE